MIVELLLPRKNVNTLSQIDFFLVVQFREVLDLLGPIEKILRYVEVWQCVRINLSTPDM